MQDSQRSIQGFVKDKPGSHTPSQQAEKSHCCLRRYWKPRLCKGHVLFSGPPAGMQSAVCRVSLPTWQALWCVLRHWGQKHSVWTARRRLQTLAHVEGKGMTDNLLIQTKCVFNHHQKCELENDSSHIKKNKKLFCGEARKKEVEKKDYLKYLELRSRNCTPII